MKFFLFPLLTVFYCTISLFAQAPTIQWQKTVGGTGEDRTASVQQTADGGYILGAVSSSNISGDKSENNFGVDDFWAVKLDADRNIQWQKTIGGDGSDFLDEIKQTTDGGYVLVGSSDSNISGNKTENTYGLNDCWIVKIDGNGALQWQTTIGGSSLDEIHSFQQTTDGGYILGATSTSGISGKKTESSKGSFDYWIIKLDGAGNIQWQNTIGGSDGDFLTAIQQTTDGGYIVGGSSYSNISSDKTANSFGASDYWILKLDITGNIEWQKTIGGSKDDQLSSLQQTADGGYIVAGFSYSNISGNKTENTVGKSDYWIVKLDVNGSIEWQNDLGGSDVETLSAIQQTIDGGYILGGSSSSNISGDKTENSIGNDCWIVKLKPNGSIQWQNNIGGDNYEATQSIQQTSDGGFVVGAFSFSGISGDKTEDSQGGNDIWLVKLSPDIVPTSEVDLQTALTIYPNPTTHTLFVRTETPRFLCLYNSIGQIISAQNIQDGDKIDLSTLPDGLYFLIETETGVAHKILKVK